MWFCHFESQVSSSTSSPLSPLLLFLSSEGNFSFWLTGALKLWALLRNDSMPHTPPILNGFSIKEKWNFYQTQRIIMLENFVWKTSLSLHSCFPFFPSLHLPPKGTPRTCSSAVGAEVKTFGQLCQVDWKLSGAGEFSETSWPVPRDRLCLLHGMWGEMVGASQEAESERAKF